MAQQTAKKRMNNKPVHVIRFGAIKAAVWLNQTSSGPMHNVTISRTYKDGDEWRESGSFGADDLLQAAKALDEAHSWVFEQRRQQGRGDPPPDDEETVS